MLYLKQMKQKIYLIDWIDSVSNPGWKNGDGLNPPLAQCQTVGFYVSESEEALTVALNRGETNCYSPYGDLISIPKVAIKRKRILK